MYSTVTRYNSGPVEFGVSAAFEREFRLFGVIRRGLTFDTRFAIPVKSSPHSVIVYLLLEGTMRWSDGRERKGPSLFVMPETDFEGENGTRTQHFRSWGEPFRSVELRIDRRHCVQEGDRELPGDTQAISAAGRTYLHASHGMRGQGVMADLAADYLRRLHEGGLVTTDLATTITRDEGFRGFVWEALRPVIDGFGGPKQEVLATRVGWSARRIQRMLSEMAISVGAGWMGGWRDIAVRYRVRVAVLLLSNPSLSIAEIASAVGYGSVEALAHALEASGLPSATDIRKALTDAADGGDGAAGVRF